MRKLSLFLFVIVCFGIHGGVLANVANTAGDNLTAYNGGNSSGANSFNNKSNARNNVPKTATANFGNCDAVIKRCAMPKCSSGGCITADVARPIVAGCVTANGTCKKHGDALIDSITSQIVAQATANANAQAAAAAAEAQAQSNAQVEQMQMQMQQMQASMQESMNAMQMQMQQQNEAANQQLQTALQEQREMMESQAAAAATPVETGTEGMTVAEQVAAKNNMSPEVLVRSQMTGQIEQGLQDTNLKLKEVKETMQRLIDYAGCDSSGSRCTGPKRVKKFKDIAEEFFEPVEEVAEKMYDTLELAMSVGVDTSDLIMMLSGACNVWGRYMCQPCNKYDGFTKNTNCLCNEDGSSCFWNDIAKGHCEIIGTLGTGDSVQQEMINNDIFGNVRVKCASDQIKNISALAGISKRRKKKGLDLDVLREILNQDEYSIAAKNEKDPSKVKGNSAACYASDQKKQLQNLVKKKKMPTLNCYTYDTDKDIYKWEGKTATDEDGCAEYYYPGFAMCNVHAYNIGKTVNPTDSTEISEMQEILGLKASFFVQQMKTQYDLLKMTMKTLQAQMEKALLTSKMEVLTGTEAGSAGKSGGVGLTGAQDCMSAGTSGGTIEVVSCLQRNLSLVSSASNKGDAKKQLEKDFKVAAKFGFIDENTTSCKNLTNAKLDDCISDMQAKLMRAKEDREDTQYRNRYGGAR